MLTEEDIKNALKSVKYPGYSRDIVSFGLVKHIAARDGAVLAPGQAPAPTLARLSLAERPRLGEDGDYTLLVRTPLGFS